MHPVWAICASARPPDQADRCLGQWRRAGYKVAILVDGDRPHPSEWDFIIRADSYRGHADAINQLCSAIVDDASIVIPIADDLHPCQERTVHELAADFFDRFEGADRSFGAMHLAKHDLSHGRSTDHCWFGAEYARRINAGRGLYWPEYFHFCDDTEAGLVAEALGVLWRRPDLGQFHDHWSLGENASRPPHLAKAGERWAASMALFEQRKAMGFPGCWPLNVSRIPQ